MKYLFLLFQFFFVIFDLPAFSNMKKIGNLTFTVQKILDAFGPNETFNNYAHNIKDPRMKEFMSNFHIYKDSINIISMLKDFEEDPNLKEINKQFESCFNSKKCERLESLKSKDIDEIITKIPNIVDDQYKNIFIDMYDLKNDSQLKADELKKEIEHEIVDFLTLYRNFVYKILKIEPTKLNNAEIFHKDKTIVTTNSTYIRAIEAINQNIENKIKEEDGKKIDCFEADFQALKELFQQINTFIKEDLKDVEKISNELRKKYNEEVYKLEAKNISFETFINIWKYIVQIYNTIDIDKENNEIKFKFISLFYSQCIDFGEIKELKNYFEIVLLSKKYKINSRSTVQNRGISTIELLNKLQFIELKDKNEIMKNNFLKLLIIKNQIESLENKDINMKDDFFKLFFENCQKKGGFSNDELNNILSDGVKADENSKISWVNFMSSYTKSIKNKVIDFQKDLLEKIQSQVLNNESQSKSERVSSTVRKFFSENRIGSLLKGSAGVLGTVAKGGLKVIKKGWGWIEENAQDENEKVITKNQITEPDLKLRLEDYIKVYDDFVKSVSDTIAVIILKDLYDPFPRIIHTVKTSVGKSASFLNKHKKNAILFFTVLGSLALFYKYQDKQIPQFIMNQSKKIMPILKKQIPMWRQKFMTVVNNFK